MAANKRFFIFDGEILAGETPVVTANSRGLMYGDGIFDTQRVYSGKTFLFSDHFARTKQGLKHLGIPLPEEVSEHSLRAEIKSLLEKTDLITKNAIIRIQFWRDGNRGYFPNPDCNTHYVITVSECAREFNQPDLVTVKTRRIPSQSLDPRFKYTNGINYIQAAREAHDKGGDDALMQTIDGSIAETTKANIFWRKGNTVYTPSDQCDILPGIMRKCIIEMVNNHEELELVRGRFELDHILNADAVWICNSVRELLPVKSINDVKINSKDEFYLDLKKAFINFRDKKLTLL